MERAKQKGPYMQVDIVRILAASFCTRHISGSMNHTIDGASVPVKDRTGPVKARATRLAQSGCTDLQTSGPVKARTKTRSRRDMSELVEVRLEVTVTNVL